MIDTSYAVVVFGAASAPQASIFLLVVAAKPPLPAGNE
jgi:hypothetical protein